MTWSRAPIDPHGLRLAHGRSGRGWPRGSERLLILVLPEGPGVLKVVNRIRAFDAKASHLVESVVDSCGGRRRIVGRQAQRSGWENLPDTGYRLHDHFRSVLSRVADKSTASACPSSLFHYTTASGLVGIIRSGELWSSNVRYLNDASELRHGRYLLTLEVERRLRPWTTTLHERNVVFPIESVFLMELQRQLNWDHMLTDRSDSAPSVYAACFCTDGDLLSQWRGYAGATGYAIGVDSSALRAATGSNGWTLQEVIYEDALQRACIATLLDEYLACLGRLADELVPDPQPTKRDINNRYKIVCDTMPVFEMVALCAFSWLKHPTFAEEQEWRLLRLVEHGSVGASNAECDVGVRIGTNLLIPYVRAPLHAEGRCVITSVTHGPTPYPHLAKQSVRQLLRTVGVAVAVKGSNAPLRW